MSALVTMSRSRSTVLIMGEKIFLLLLKDLEQGAGYWNPWRRKAVKRRKKEERVRVVRWEKRRRREAALVKRRREQERVEVV